MSLKYIKIFWPYFQSRKNWFLTGWRYTSLFEWCNLFIETKLSGRIISKNGEFIWPPRSCDLVPLDYFVRNSVTPKKAITKNLFIWVFLECIWLSKYAPTFAEREDDVYNEPTFRYFDLFIRYFFLKTFDQVLFETDIKWIFGTWSPS